MVGKIKLHTQIVALPGQELWRFCQYLVAHRKACVEAEGVDQTYYIIYPSQVLTFADVNVLRRTATVCSWDDTSSIVLGRLVIMRTPDSTNEIFRLTTSLPMAVVQDQMYVLLLPFGGLDFGRKPLVSVKVMSLTRTWAARFHLH